MNEIVDGFVGAIGNTPLIRLRRASERTGCEILAKAEFLEPGGSIKDRTALFLVDDGERRGLLRPGGVVVEGTAGNTGIGLTLVANARGYRTIIVIPETQSREKKDLLRLYGADVREVPAAPFRDPGNYVHVAERLAAELAEREPNGAFYANQWDNLANREGHRASTGPEIWRQTGGRIDGFVCAIGTGGTLAGISAYLKSVHPRIRTAVADPVGADQPDHPPGGQVKRDIRKRQHLAIAMRNTLQPGDGFWRCHGVSAPAVAGRSINGGVRPTGQLGRWPSGSANRTQTTPRTPVLT